ncbi:hypothetical protein HDU98_005569 [Podochytrium sp. JEL0797]|nr:hypothetical protein HDU98_005569 [Podochytrium sp. JEL0797]
MQHHQVFLACILLLGNYYAYDTPASLSVQLNEFLEMEYADFQLLFSLFFAVYSLPNTILPFFSGKLTDAVGSHRMLLVCCAVNTFGQVMVNVGLVTGNVPLALLGRFIFGIGGESCRVAQAVFIASFCDGKTLLLATATTVFFGKLGSILNAFMSPLLEHYFGIEIALFAATVACIMSLCLAILLYSLTVDVIPRALSVATERAPLILNPDAEIIDMSSDLDVIEPTPQNFTSPLMQLPFSFWIVCLTFVMFRGSYFCFNNTALDFLTAKWYIGDNMSAGFAMSIPVVVSISLLGICGSQLLPDTTGFFISFLSMLAFAVLHLILGFTSLTPTISLALIGVVGSINQTVMNPFVNLLIKRHEQYLHAQGTRVNLQGLAYGVNICAQNIALMVIPLCVAWILRTEGNVRWEIVELFFAGLCGIGAWGAGWLWWSERARDE